MAQNLALHLENLPLDPAQEARKNSQDVISTEEASLRQRELDTRLKSMTYEEIEKLANDLMQRFSKALGNSAETSNYPV